jgi:hypothetical protein
MIQAVDQHSELMRCFGERMGMPALTLNAAGVCELVFDGKWRVTLVLDGAQRALLLDCAFAQTGADPQRAPLADALRANHLSAGAAGGWLCLDEGGRPHLQRRLPLAGLEVAELSHAVEALLNAAEKWDERWARGVAASPGSGPPGGPPPWVGMRV